MANINKRMKQNIENLKVANADKLTALEAQERYEKRKSRTRYTIMMFVYAAIYFFICFFTQKMSYDMHQFRIAEALAALVFFDPAAFPGVTIGCLAANVIGPGGLYDAIFGTCGTAFGLYIMKWWSERNGKPYVGLALYAFFNAFLIALELNYSQVAEAGNQIFTIFAWVMLGEVVCAVLGGTILHTIIGRFWKDVVSETKKGEDEEYHPTNLQ